LKDNSQKMEIRIVEEIKKSQLPVNTEFIAKKVGIG
jgi:hypothetical protein